MRILALDPAKSTGFAFSSIKDRVEHSGVWFLGADESARPGRLAEYIRLAHRDWQPDTIAFELATMGGRHLHVMRRMNELAGAIQAVSLELGCTSWAFGIGTWKARLGNGRMEKPDVVRVLRTMFGIEVNSFDEGDAVGILVAAQLGAPPEPKKQTVRRMKKAAKREPRLF